MLADKTLKEIQSDLLSGALTFVALVRYYIDRAKTFESYNAIITMNEMALKEAEELDKRMAKGESLGALFGCVVLLKDNIGTKDMPVTAGAKILEGVHAKRDAFIVRQLKENDAIILGKANLSEWANYMSEPSSNGYSVLGGQTQNAYGDYDAGGSSSGSAVGVALDMCTVSIGSETCGSLVYPASMNSVVTLKPTVGLISRDLVIPITEAQDTLGPMGRCVEDVWSMTKACIGYDVNDPRGKKAQDFDMSQMDYPLEKNYLKGKRVGLLKENSERYEQLVLELEAMDVTIVPFEINQEQMGIDMLTVLDYGIVVDIKAFFGQNLLETEVKSLKDIVTFNNGNPEKRMPYGQKRFEDAIEKNISYDTFIQIENKNHQIATTYIDDTLKKLKVDVLVSFVTEMAVLYSVARYPAVNVAAGYQSDGMPYGITFVAGELTDAHLLRCAYAYEQHTNHRKTPKEVNL